MEKRELAIWFEDYCFRLTGEEAQVEPSSLRIVPAACHDPQDRHEGHSACFGAWRDQVEKQGGRVIREPVFLNNGWWALVSLPPEVTGGRKDPRLDIYVRWFHESVHRL